MGAKRRKRLTHSPNALKLAIDGPACSPVGLRRKASSSSHILPKEWLMASATFSLCLRAGRNPANDHAMSLLVVVPNRGMPDI